MPKLEYFVVAESVTVDQFTNRVSLFNVCDEVAVLKFPASLGQLVAVCSWNAEEADIGKDFQVGVVLRTSDGTKGPFTSNFTMKGKRHRTVLALRDFRVSKAGRVEFEVTLNSEHAASHVVDVYSIEAPP